MITKAGFTTTIQIEEQKGLTLPDHERQTIVHCQMRLPPNPDLHIWMETLIRIWPTTFLIQDNGIRKKLLFFDKITAYPVWMTVRLPHTFTLIFEGLDEECLQFDLVEEIPQQGGFEARDILRNTSDVYRMDII